MQYLDNYINHNKGAIYRMLSLEGNAQTKSEICNYLFRSYVLPKIFILLVGHNWAIL